MLLGATEATLEAEIANKGALGLYDKLGFSREEMMGRYYLNGGDAYKLRLKLDKFRLCKNCSVLVSMIRVKGAAVGADVDQATCPKCSQNVNV